MAIHLTRVYTRTGDDGTSGLGDFSRVPKTHPRLVAYADVDETNAAIGVALSLGQLPVDLAAILLRVQNELFDVGADLCVPIEDEDTRLRVSPAEVRHLETDCDTVNEKLGTLDSFILPGGTPGAALLHQARTIARRAERSAWALLDAEPDRTNVLTAQYLNRLSDLLFVLARAANPDGDVLWRPGASR
ncbi:MAG TPA: cob(I)yrinic acid a,c-diamide adenosyltransferase [Mycobacteriales bacterium]|jgi:cob(I)alamin adenosyltransferase|nr:cob(I)yrinic acid a,c-diamide adenosyltransferase [Mycobacteriales bacterium]